MKIRRFTALLVALTLLLSSCVFKPSESGNTGSSGGTLVPSEPAEYNGEFAPPSVEEPVEEQVVTGNEGEVLSLEAENTGDGLPESLSFTFSGGFVFDNAIASDASARSDDGGYSFMKMFTGVYSFLNEADYTFAFYRPDEALKGKSVRNAAAAAVEKLGADVLLYSGECPDTDTARTIAASGGLVRAGTSGFTVSTVALGQDCTTEAALNRIRSERQRADYLIVTVMWNGMFDADGKKDAAEKIADAGADMLIGLGDTIAGAEYIGDMLCFYSLGRIMSSSEYWQYLLSGILTFDIKRSEEGFFAENIKLTPTIVHYENGFEGFQVFVLSSYDEESAREHALAIDCPSLLSHVRQTVPPEFLK